MLVECGNTRVMCTATFTAGVPRWRKDSGLGWVTAEYSMLPRATAERTDRVNPYVAKSVAVPTKSAD